MPDRVTRPGAPKAGSKMRRNLRSSLRTKSCATMMQDYDGLPPALRHWIAQAHLPWSVRSARRIWAKHGGDVASALATLQRAEQATLARDIRKIWGASHPAIRA